MAKIVDPDQLNQGTEVVINTTNKTVQLLVAGNLDDNNPSSTSGVTKQALYSFLKEEWKSDSALNKFKFPLKSFTKNEFQWINGWSPADAQTRQLFRDAGWQETVGTENGDIYAGLISLGSFDSVADQGYYAQVAGFNQSTTNFDKTGNVNESVLVNDASGSNFTGYFKAFLREQGKLYDSYNLLTEQGIAALEPTLYRFPLSNSTDLNISASDAYIDLNSAVTFTNATNLVNLTAHPLINGNKVRFTLSGGTLPAELSTGTTYFVINATANTFQVSLTSGGSAVNFTTDGTATVNVVSWPYNGMTAAYVSGVGFTTWASATVYPAESVVQSSGGRWFFTDLGGTSAGNDTNLGGGSDTGVTWVPYVGERQIGASYYAFNRIIEASGGTRGEAYHWMMRQLRKTLDINTGTISDVNQDTVGVVNGNVADEFAVYRGGDVVLEEGVYLDNFAASEINNIVFVPVPVNSGAATEVTFPFVVVVTLNFPSNVVNEVDADTRGTNYFTNDAAGDNVGDNFDTATAHIVKDSTAGVTITFTNATNLVNETAHGLVNGTRILLENSGGALPTGLVSDQVYFVINANANDYQLSLTEGGSAQTFSTDGTGTTTRVVPVDFDGADLTGSTFTYSYDYDNNKQRGTASAGKDAPITLQLVGAGSFEIGTTEYTITRTATLNVNIVATDERNYSNPA